MQETNSYARQPKSWTASELEQLTKTLAVIINGQKAYGKDHSLKDTLAYYTHKLQGKFTMRQVLWALDKYTDQHNDIPAPSDLINLISPPPPRITYAQYQRAVQQHALEGYPMFGYYGQVIKDYEAQQAESGQQPDTQPDRIAAARTQQITYGGDE